MDKLKKEFGQIYDDNVDRIYRFVYLKVNSQEIAQDITADTFTKVWKSYLASQKGPFNKKIKNERAFCYRIARNLVTDYYRKKATSNPISLDYNIPIVDTKETTLEERAMINSDMEGVRKALAGLKDEYQNIIIWHYLDELSVPEIAKMIKRSEGTTRVRIHRALSALKNVMES